MNFFLKLFKDKERLIIKFLFLVITIIYFYQINKFVNNNVQSTTSWWFYNYSQGFIRRGLVGEFLFFFSKFINLNIFHLIKLIHSFLFLFFIYLFFQYIKKIKYINYYYLLLIFSPIGLMVYVYDPFFIGRPEIFIFITIIIYINILENRPNYYKILLISLLSSISILIHESYFFYLSYFFFLHIFFKNKNEHQLNFFFIFIIMPIITMLCIIFFDRLIDVNLMCKNIFELDYYRKICVDQMLSGSKIMTIQEAITSTKDMLISHNYFSVYLKLSLLSLSLFLIFLLSVSAKIKFLLINFLFILLNFLYSLPLFILAYDWGRWLFIHFMILIIIFGLHLQKKITSFVYCKYRIFFSLFCIVYLATWSIPHCCSTFVGDGFLGIIVKIFYLIL